MGINLFLAQMWVSLDRSRLGLPYGHAYSLNNTLTLKEARLRLLILSIIKDYWRTGRPLMARLGVKLMGGLVGVLGCGLRRGSDMLGV